MIVSRTCTEISRRDGERPQQEERRSRPLEEFRDTPAYVLVGDPGAGKTTAFETEREALGEKAFLVTARDFLTFDPQHHPEWRGKTLFIDGLDEIRAGSSDVRTPFDQVRGRLDSLGKPRFRLSCREADWLGENDRKHLEAVSPDSSVTVVRLDPLTDEDIARILDARRDIQDADAFIKAAKERRVEGLLPNPLTLEMLADVVGGGSGWPESRMQTFAMACLQMVREHNEERAAAQESGSSPALGELLDAAGRLCAIQLISGGSGYTLHGEGDEEYLSLDECDYDVQVLRFALSTKLFKGVSSNRFAPVHRHVAEYLGGRHLAEVIENGLPACRVIAMMTGEDGTVVTEMRGLSAWLAALSCQIQEDLIQGDPVGVGLYGDIGQFTLDGKRALLQSLKREGARLDSVWTCAGSFGALATSEMEADLREVLLDTDRSRDHQAFTDFVLRFLGEGTPLPDIGGLLIELVRDDRRWPRVNTSALNAFIHNCPDSQDRADGLKSLLADIRAERVSDPDKELFGTLLTHLYPQELLPSEIWEYLSAQGHPELYGTYRRFWDTRLVEQSSDEQLAELLDHLPLRLPRLRTALDTRHLSALPLKLLAGGLELHGDHLEPERLYDWLSAGLLWDEDPQTSRLGAEPIRRIRDWLEEHPESRKAVHAEGLDRSLSSDEFQSFSFTVRKRLYGASPPPDFGLWCLERAVSMANERPLAAGHLLEMAFQAHCHRSGNADLSLEVLQEQARKNVRLEKCLDQLLSAPSTYQEHHQEHLEYQEKRQQAEEREQQQWLDCVRSQKTELLENRAAPQLLYHLATHYFMGPKAIEEQLRGDRGLIDAVLHGLRGVIDRKDVPDLSEILRLRKEKKTHFLDRPFLASIEMAESATDPFEWDDDLVRKAIGFYYCSDLSNHELQWYRRLLGERPETVGQVLVQFALSGFRDGRETDRLSGLLDDPQYATVANQVSLPLLRSFPTRCKVAQIQDLKYLLWAALQSADRDSLLDLIEEKLTYRSMSDGQRVYWLAAGVIVSPEVYGDLLREFSEGHEGRMRHLTAFFSRGSLRSVVDGLESPALELLVRLVGGTVEPDEHWREGPSFTPAMKASRLVGDLIQRLSACPAEEASDALARLLRVESLSQWHDKLSQAQDAQRVIRRDAGYRHPGIEQVCRTLNGGTPANAADLAALLMDQLRELAVQIRRGNTDGWRQYWNVDSGGCPEGPRHEDVCRDALLDALRQRLPLAVDAQPEGQYANDKRADIRVSCPDFQVPVEIKKNGHLKLWSALRNQLIAQYTSDPATGGYGIYLVFWFGKGCTQSPPSGSRPAGPEELSERLAAEANLTPAEARKISICVVDVSRPDG